MGLVCVWPALAGAAVPALDALATREAAATKVCLVTVQDQLGLPIAYATGFLLGEGKFVVTDLASVARPGVKDVVLRFRDGKTAKAQKFGMADPAIGLVALQIEPPLEGATGLTPASAPPTAEAPEVAVVGWRYAQELSLSLGRVGAGLAAADLATRLKTAAPKPDLTFLGFEGARPDVAGGAPVLDRAGEVVGVAIFLAGADRPLLVPAALLKASLLVSDRQLRPLSQLPRPVWPVEVQPLAGKPPGQSDFAQSVRAIRLRCRCGQCNATGQISVEKIVGYRTVLGVSRPIIRVESHPCPKCNGERLALPGGFYSQFGRMAETGTWLALGPGVDLRTRDAALQVSMELVETLARVGKGFRDDLIKEANADLNKGDLAFPEGMLVFAQVRDVVDGPDGKYHLLDLAKGGPRLAVRTDRWAAAGDRDAAAPGMGQWIILAGAANGRASIGQREVAHVLPFRWADGPNLGGPPLPRGGKSHATPPPTPTPAPTPAETPAPTATPTPTETPTPAATPEPAPTPAATPEPAPTPTPTPKKPPPKKPGEPNFFGL
jgi:hypothetical protein